MNSVKNKILALLDEFAAENCTVIISVFSDFYHLTSNGDDLSISVEDHAILVDMANTSFSLELAKVVGLEEYETEYGKAILLRGANGNLEISGA